MNKSGKLKFFNHNSKLLIDSSDCIRDLFTNFHKCSIEASRKPSIVLNLILAGQDDHNRL